MRLTIWGRICCMHASKQSLTEPKLSVWHFEKSTKPGQAKPSQALPFIKWKWKLWSWNDKMVKPSFYSRAFMVCTRSLHGVPSKERQRLPYYSFYCMTIYFFCVCCCRCRCRCHCCCCCCCGDGWWCPCRIFCCCCSSRFCHCLIRVHPPPSVTYPLHLLHCWHRSFYMYIKST